MTVTAPCRIEAVLFDADPCLLPSLWILGHREARLHCQATDGSALMRYLARGPGRIRLEIVTRTTYGDALADWRYRWS